MKIVARCLPMLGILCGLALSGCSSKTESTTTPAATPAVTVSTAKAQARDFPVNLKATGVVAPLTSVEVRAQVTSTVNQVHFKEGQFVKAGQLLFTLDARTDEANLAKARAQLTKDNASLADANRQLERTQQLLAQNFVSQGAVDTARTQVDGLAATAAADQAAIDAVRVALSYARITAPNSGRAGAVNLFAGSAVQANLTSLVTITQLDPISVVFSIPQRNLSDAITALKDGGAVVSATLADGGGSFKGRLQFVDNAVDASSGTVKAKAVFDNPDSKLWPGAFVEVSQTVKTLKDAVVVPQAAIIESLRGTMLYVVDNAKADLRPIKLLYAEGSDAAITGVKPGERVVLDGKQNLRPGSAVVERAKEPKAAASDTTKQSKP